jgi:hypothetical protein
LIGLQAFLLLGEEAVFHGSTRFDAVSVMFKRSPAFKAASTKQDQMARLILTS